MLKRIKGKEIVSGVTNEAAAMKVMMAKKVLSSGSTDDEKTMNVDEPRRSPVVHASQVLVTSRSRQQCLRTISADQTTKLNQVIAAEAQRNRRSEMVFSSLFVRPGGY